MSILPDGRYIDDAPYVPDDGSAGPVYLEPSYSRLMWRKFRRQWLALVSGCFC